MGIAKIVLISLFGALFILPVSSHAVPIASGMISVHCSAGTGADDSQVINSTSSTSCSYSYPSIATLTANSQATFSTTPSLSSSANVSATGSRFDFYANGGGSLLYFMDIVATAPAPVVTDTIPITFSASGSVSINGDAYSGSSSGTAYASVGSPFPSSPLAFPTDAFSVSLSGLGSASFDNSVTLDLQLPHTNEYYHVNVGAGCQARATKPGAPDAPVESSSTACNAFVDPSFSFNQSAFDSLMGANTFNLADYYKIELSDNLAPPPPPPLSNVPEPPGIVLMSLGLGLLYLRRRLGQRG